MNENTLFFSFFDFETKNINDWWPEIQNFVFENWDNWIFENWDNWIL